MATKLRAVLLAAGEGSRLRPLTDHVPKPMLPIDGQPVILTLVDQLAALDIPIDSVVVGYHGSVLEGFLREQRPALRSARYVEQPERLGSAHALQLAARQRGAAHDAFVAATDTRWRSEDVAAIVEAFDRHPQALVVMGMRRWPVAQLPHRSRVDVDDALRVQRVLEKPPADASEGSALSGSPIYAWRAAFWDYVLAVPPGPKLGIYELAVALQAAIDDGHHVQGVEVTATRDITRPEDVLRFNFPYLADYLPTQE